MIPIGKWKNGPVNTRPGATLSSIVTHTHDGASRSIDNIAFNNMDERLENYLDEKELKFKTASIFIPLIKKSQTTCIPAVSLFPDCLKMENNHK
jgi:hypothetical protein